MTSNDEFVRLLPSAELTAAEGLDSQIRDVRIGEEAVLVGRLGDGRVVAFAASCPHERTDLHQATFVDGRVRCPRHNYMYDPHSGENCVPARIARRESLWKLHPGYLPTYAVEERDGWVWVSRSPNPPPSGWDPSLEEAPTQPARDAATPGSSPEHAAPPPPTVDVPPKRLRVRLGKEFELRLPMGAPAHTWRVETPPDLLVLVEQRIDPASPPRQRVRIAARAVGRGTLRCSFGRPWDPEPDEVRTYIVEVVDP